MRRMLCACLPVLCLAFAATTAAQDKPIAHAFYPLKVGNEWTYRSGKEKVVIRADREVPLDYTPSEGKTVKAVGFVLKITSGAREVPEQVAVLTDGVYRFSTAGKAIKPPLRFFKFGGNAGDRWAVESKTDDGKTIKGAFVAGIEKLPLTLGGKQIELTTWTVTSKDFTVDDEEITIKYWFAENIGMVKQYVRTGKLESTLELRDFKAAP